MKNKKHYDNSVFTNSFKRLLAKEYCRQLGIAIQKGKELAKKKRKK